MSDHSISLNQSAIGQRFHAATTTVVGGFIKGTAAVRRGLAAFVKQMQYSRMMSALAASSDLQLKSIGIKRSEIPRYAAKLVDYEYDGL
jgi:uncharacterized protein YjiS (DUF1127 family)